MGIDVIAINLILAIPTYFICRFIFRRINHKGLRRVTTWLTTIALTPVIYVGLILIWFAVASYYPERDFEKEKWMTDIEKRYEMADDLVDNEKLIGKTKKEIIELLGQEENNPEGSHWIYYIGCKPSLIGIDPDILEIEFKGDKVVKCWTWRT